ncbi:MAG: sensor histidine kinase KdpD [Capsulimonadaceae bacterium]
MSRDDDEKIRRPSPEELLERVTKAERKANRGRLKVFLGFAAGVGKTFEMLSEANRRMADRGQDIVIGYVETHGRRETVAQIGKLEIVPRKTLEYRGTVFEEMDTDAIIARCPQWVLVDELAHTNVPGSKHEKRYQDVMEILDAGINVQTTLNVQHLESLNDTVQQITNVKVRETVPDWILGEADEIVTIDITPRSLINRLERGDVYPKEKVPQALENFFTEGNLSALREIALREVATEVERSVQNYRQEQNIGQVWQTQEKVMVCMSPTRSCARLLRRGWRIAHRLKAGIVAVYIPLGKTTLEQQEIMQSDFLFAERLGIKIERIDAIGNDVAAALSGYALSHQVTQVIVGHSERSDWQHFWSGSIVNKLIRLCRGIDVLVVAHELPKDSNMPHLTA